LTILGRTDFDRAFMPDTIFEVPDFGSYQVQQVEAGELALPTGRIIAFDPANLCALPKMTQPFAQVVAPGNYPVVLSIATWMEPDTNDQRVACAKLVLKNTPAINWEMARRPGQEQPLPQGHIYGYIVDSGLGCFVDAAVVDKIAPEVRQVFCDELLDKMLQADADGQDWLNVPLNSDPATNAIMYWSGYGDGVYPSFWGIDQTGEICCLVTDFRVLVDSISKTARFTFARWTGKTLRHADFAAINLSIYIEPIPSNAQEIRIKILSGSCRLLIRSSGKSYLSRQMTYNTEEGKTQYFFLDEPLTANARLIVSYSQGIYAL
jgi:hypothetical protein